MVVKIDRYYKWVNARGNGYIHDRLHEEKIVEISTRNKILTENLINVCMDYLNEGLESNDDQLRKNRLNS